MPSGLDALCVSDTAEDLAPLTPHAVRRLNRLLPPWRYLVALEALVAAQAVDLRGIAPLGEDRDPGADVEDVAAVLDGWAATAP